MSILIALIPAISWGIVPLIVNKVKGRPVNQILGMGLDAVLVGILVALANGVQLGVGAFILAMLAGALWTAGQIGQFVSFIYCNLPYTKKTGKEIPASFFHTIISCL
ncbi:MAG: GRP family sugar transporter [Candidatus Limosilactobacillus intestinavium]